MREQSRERILIMGGGLAGLSAGYALSRVGTRADPHPEIDEPFDLKVVPWKWAPVRVPRTRPGRAAKDLYARGRNRRRAGLRRMTRRPSVVRRLRCISRSSST